MAFVPWTDIALAHNLRKNFLDNPALATAEATARYRAKVKLHGNNMAIQRCADGTLEVQSRNTILTPQADLDGFAKWVEGHRAEWLAALEPGTIVFGEWCGPGIQGGTALNQLPHRVFAVFAAHRGEADPGLVVEPLALDALLPQVILPGLATLPWYGEPIEIDWRASAADLEAMLATVNAAVAEVEACDPWVAATFGVRGTGEGLVYYPQDFERRDDIYLRMFKAKGAKHREIKAKVPAQVDPAVAASIEAFVDLVLPQARLDHGVAATTPDGATPRFDPKRLGAFLQWIGKDVEKETAAELAASGLDAAKVRKAVTDRARGWYLAQAKAGG